VAEKERRKKERKKESAAKHKSAGMLGSLIKQKYSAEMFGIMQTN